MFCRSYIVQLIRAYIMIVHSIEIKSNGYFNEYSIDEANVPIYSFAHRTVKVYSNISWIA